MMRIWITFPPLLISFLKRVGYTFWYMKGKILLVVIALIIIALGVSYYVGHGNSDFVFDTDKPIVIGFIGPFTGDAASYGEPVSNAVRLAVDEINERGGVSGRPLEVIYEDGGCDDFDAVNAAEKLVGFDDVEIIIGGVCSGETLAILPITEENNVLVLSPSSSSPDLSGAGEYFFRNNPSDARGGAFLADIVYRDDKHGRVAVISEDTNYAQALRGVFSTRFVDLGGEVVADESFESGTSDFRSILTTIKAANPDAIFINPQLEDAGGTIARQIAELGIDAQLYGSNILSGSEAIEVGGASVDGITFFDNPELDPSNTKAENFLANYQEQYGDLSIEFYLGAAYDAVYLLDQSIRAVGTDTDALREYFTNLRAFKGVIGTYSFDEYHDLSGVEPVLKRIENGEVVTIK